MVKNKALVEQKSGEMTLSPDHVAAIEKTQATGTAMMEVGQQFLLATEEVLQREFGFTEQQLRHLEEKLRYMLTSLVDVERKGLSVLSMVDMRSIGEIAQIREARQREKQTGILLPSKKIN